MPANGGLPASAGITFPASTIYAESADSRREPNIWVFDTRFERTFNITDRVRFRGFLDFFNIKRDVQMNGWRFEGLVVVRNGIVLFRNSAGESKLNTFEKTTNPLGPFQRSGESSDLLLR